MMATKKTHVGTAAFGSPGHGEARPLHGVLV
jgi:hypothetical protein